jgi:hypothetical protein
VIVGHPAVAFASKRMMARVPLAWLILAPLWLDLIWPVFLLLGIELYAAGVWLYVTGTRAKDRTGVLAFWSMVVLFLVIYAAAIFGPPPPNETAIAWSALVGWLFVPWAAWIDRHREPATD